MIFWVTAVVAFSIFKYKGDFTFGAARWVPISALVAIFCARDTIVIYSIVKTCLTFAISID
jgi:hypothetical protein